MTRTLAIGLLVAANIIWGTSHVVAKIALAELPPTLLGALRFTILAAALWGLRLAGFERSGEPDPPKRLRWQLLALGLIALVSAYVLLYEGAALTTATDGSLMIIGEVIWTLLLARLILAERLGPLRALGIALGIAGAAAIVLGGAGEATASAPNRPLGNVLFLCGLFFEACHSVIGAKLTQRYAPLTVMRWLYTGALIGWVPILLWHAAYGHLASISLGSLIGAAYLALAASLLGSVVWFRAIQVVGAHVAAASLLVQPLVGALLGLWLLQDPLSAALLLGGALVLLAFWLTSRTARPAAV